MGATLAGCAARNHMRRTGAGGAQTRPRPPSQRALGTTKRDKPRARESHMPKVDLKGSVRRWVLGELLSDEEDNALKAQLEGKDTHELLVVYHNWASRLLQPRPRKVHQSAALAMNPLFIQLKAPLAQIVADIKDGRALTKYLSKRVLVVSQPPGENTKLQRRRDLDLLLNDWGMHHLHLSTEIREDGFVERTGPLLFAVFKPDDAYLLDIMDHGGWTSRHLLEVLVREFPESDSFHVIKGVSGLRKEHSEEDHRRLRNAGINTAFMIDSRAVWPREGMVSTGTTIAASRAADALLLAVEEFENNWNTKPSEIRLQLEKLGVTLPDDAVLEFIVDDKGPGVLETRSRTLLRL